MVSEHADPRDLVTIGLDLQCMSVDTIEDEREPSFSNIVPEIAVISDSDVDFQSSIEITPPTLLTVEGFLSKSATKPPRTCQSRRLATAQNRRRKTASKSGAYKLRERRNVEHRRCIPRTTRAKLKKTRLAEKLYRAVVLTHGDPLESIEDPDTLGRRPLTFVTINKFTTPPRAAIKKDDIADAPNDVYTSKTSVQPVSQDSQHSRGRSSHRSARPMKQPGRCSPLDFVPYRQAEAAYSQLFKCV